MEKQDFQDKQVQDAENYHLEKSGSFGQQNKGATQVAGNSLRRTSDMAYDDVLERLGEFGRYQKRIYFLLCLPAISCALHKLVGVFLQAKLPYRCKLPHETAEASYIVEERNTSDYSYTAYYPSSCTYQYTDWGTNDNVTTQCSQWIYDTTTYTSTTLSEWDMVCDRAWLKATADAIFMIGVLLGSIIFGDLSDRYGRRPIFFISLIIQVTAGILVGLSPNYATFVILRMLVGAASSGVFLVAYVIALEMVGPKKRMFAGVACQMFFTTGYIMVAGFAYLIRNWRWLQIAVSLPGLLFLSYWWFIPESARWLITKNRHKKAHQILMKVAKENKVPIQEDSLTTLLEKDENNAKQQEEEAGAAKKNPTVLELFKYPNLRKKSLTIFFLWFVNSATYYGLSWNTGNLAGNEYINFLISGLVEYPAYTFLLLTLNRWGRKVILCGSMTVAAVALLLNIAVPSEMTWLTVTLAMIGKLAISASYGTVYIFSAEQFPTVIRNVGMGASSTFARFGGILAPYINISAEVFIGLPLIIFGFLALVSVLFAFMLPETHNKKLPDTIMDGEEFGRKREAVGVQTEGVHTTTSRQNGIQ